MKRCIQVMAAVAGGVAGSAAAAIGAGTLLWNRSTARDVGRLAPRGPAGTITRDRLAGLPAPVVRYFEFALPPGQPLIRSARIEHEGELRGGLDKPWSPFKSVQHFSVEPPGFVWDAKIRMAPLLTVRVRTPAPILRAFQWLARGLAQRLGPHGDGGGAATGVGRREARGQRDWRPTSGQ